jgi:hypothetical protein
MHSKRGVSVTFQIGSLYVGTLTRINVDITERTALVFSFDLNSSVGLTQNHENRRICRDVAAFKSVLRGRPVTNVNLLNFIIMIHYEGNEPP